MKKIIDAYYDGTNGKPLGEKASRGQRIAHSIGRRAFRKAEEADKAQEIALAQQLEDAIEVSVGANKQALQIIKSSAHIPNQPKSRPAWGYDYTEAGKREHRWDASYHFAEPGNVGDTSFSTPLSEAIGHLEVDLEEWVSGGLKLPIRNVSIIVGSPKDDDGRLGPAHTTIFVNSTKYDPEKPLSESPDLRGDARIDIGSDGLPEYIAIGRMNVSGLTNMVDPGKASVKLDSFMNHLQAAVMFTARDYEQLGNQKDKPDL